MKTLSKSEQTTVMEIAMQALLSPSESLLQALDMSDEEASRLWDKLNQIMNPAPTKPREVTINAEQQLYVIPCGANGITGRGFQSLFDETNAMAGIIGKPKLEDAEFGTMFAYDYNANIVREFSAHPASKNTWFDAHTLPEVREVLETCRKHRKTIRVFLGDVKTGRCWLDAHDVLGRVGRSMGPVRVPLLVPKGEDGGGAILTDCIVKLMDVDTGKVLYVHPKFNLPELRVRPVSQYETDILAQDLRFEVLADGALQARFYTERQANDYIAFLKGERMRLPVAKKQ